MAGAQTSFDVDGLWKLLVVYEAENNRLGLGDAALYLKALVPCQREGRDSVATSLVLDSAPFCARSNSRFNSILLDLACHSQVLILLHLQLRRSLALL